MADAPTLAATATHNSVTLTWNAPSDNGGAAITSYRIERENDDGSWSNPRSVPVSALTWTARGLENSTEYTYRIVAVNAAGDSDWTSASVITLANAPEAPSAPTSASPVPGPANVKLVWEAPAFNGGAAITRYEYRYKLDSSTSYGSWRRVDPDPEVTEFTVPNLIPGTLYDFEVRAVNSAGAGPALEYDMITPEATAPTAKVTTLSSGRL